MQHYLYKSTIQTVIDIDLKNFFGTIDHEILEDILKEKIKDTKFMRCINRMFKAGVLSEFINEAKHIVFKWLNRRSQRRSFTWEAFEKYIETHPLPTVKIVHRLF